MIDLAGLIELVADWRDPSDGEAAKSQELVLGLLRGTPAPFSRDQFTPGHITGSACILHPAGDAVLLIHHGKLHRWLLPGGHVEIGLDRQAADTARREAEEEAGVRLDGSVPGRLAGIDVHGIPARKSDPFHLHHDLIFRFRAAEESFVVSEEVRDVAWCPVDRLEAYALPGPIRRAVQRALAE
ncbi:MAG TPA: NUDIX domain-containing protein [Bryobacteraceae bacterium]|nr:NUDIX domain-containing protein [Bryobacteraceae bacterium]